MEEEKKYIYNDKAERIKKMNRFYIGATYFLEYCFYCICGSAWQIRIW